MMIFKNSRNGRTKGSARSDVLRQSHRVGIDIMSEIDPVPLNPISLTQSLKQPQNEVKRNDTKRKEKDERFQESISDEPLVRSTDSASSDPTRTVPSRAYSAEN